MLKKAAFIFFLGLAWVGLLTIVDQANADPTVWTNLGLNGGNVQTLAVDPTDPETIFCGIYLGEGLYRSTDGAAAWQALRMAHRVAGEDTFENQMVWALAVAPGNPDTVWAAHNQWVAKSTDGGATWHHIPNAVMQKNCRNCSGNREDQFRQCLSLAIDPYDADTVYVGTGGPMNTYTNGAVYRTTDGGGTWEKLNLGADLDYAVCSVVLHHQRPGAIWISTSSNGRGGVWDGSVYSSTDHGDSFGSPDPRPISGSGLSGLTWHPGDPNVVFVTGAFGVARMVIEGTRWLPALAVDGSGMAARVAFAPSDDNVAYVGWNRPTAWGGDGLPKLSRSRDGGLTWETVPLDPSMASNPNSIVVDPRRATTLYWGDASGGVLKSEDGGDTWKPVNQDLNGIIVRDVDSDPRSGDHLIAGTTGGVYERVDGQWHKRLNRDTASVRFDPDDSRVYYAGLWNSLARTRDGGATWHFSSDSPNGFVSHIDIDLRSTNTLYIADNIQILRSTDGGDTFRPVLAGINARGEVHQMNVVAIDPGNSRRILAGGGNFYIPKVVGGLWESLDGGETWKVTGLTDVVVNDVLIHPDNPAILYAGCGHSDNSDTPLFKSTDSGGTWTAAMDGLPPEHVNLQAVWVSEAGELFAVTGEGRILHMANGLSNIIDSGTRQFLHDIFGLGADSVLAVGDMGTILHYDGSAWAVMESPVDVNLRGIWGSSTGRFYAVGDQGRILLFNGEVWSEMASPVSVTLYEIFGISDDAIMAVGAGGTILRYDGRQWVSVASPSTDDLYAVWGASGNHWFTAGENGAFVAFDGDAVSVMESGTDANILGVWGRAQDDLYAVTSIPGTLLHYDGRDWNATAAPHDRINDIWGRDGRGVYAVQGQGGIFRYDGNRWEILRPPGSRFRSVTDLEFHRINPNIVYAATDRAGVYLSPDQGNHWLNLGKPRLSVNAIAVGSLYAATGGGLYQLTGTGVLAGKVYDSLNHAMIEGAQVAIDIGLRNIAMDGRYMLVVPAGIFDVYATADQHEMNVARDVTVIGGDVSWQDFEMGAGISASGGATGTLTKGGNRSGSGSYCFISACSSTSTASFVWGSFCLAAGFALWAGWAKCKWGSWLVLFSLVGFSMMVPQASAFTIFEQVGVTSPPLPVGSGARAMGMGGTFIAIADDATAASWNPAGLVQLDRPEMSIVADGYLRDESFTSDAHPEVSHTGHNNHCNLNYFSVTFPFQWRKNMAFSINYQQLYDFHRELDFRRNLSQNDVQLDQQINFNQSGTVGAVGLAGAVELTSHLSLGLTFNIWTDQLGYDNGWKAHYRETATGSQAGVPTAIHTRIQDDYDQFRGINFNLGLLWDLNQWGTLGAVVKTPFKATIQHHFHLDQIQTFGAPLDTTVNNGPVQIDEEVELHLPLSLGAGWSKRFSDSFTLGVDIYRTQWSGYYLKDSQGDKFSPVDGRRRSDSDIDATTHLRFGAEYLLMWPHKKLSVPLRLGLFYDPEPSEGHPEDLFGFALGTGISNPRYSIDFAYQLRWAQEIDTGNIIATSNADILQHTVLASLIYYF